MGSCATKNSENEVTIPTNPHLLRYYQQYSQIININHPLNVNQKYNSYFTLIPDQFTGNGIKQTNKYESRLSQEEWLAKRQEFWDSRIEGQKDNWVTIKAALEADEATAKTLLQAADLKLINNSMQIVFDNRGILWEYLGQKYDLPVFVMHNPVSFPQKKSYDQNLFTSFDKQKVTFKVRSTKWNQDMEVSYNTNDKVELLIKELQKKENPGKMRLFMNGREMCGHNMFGNYGVQQNSVFNISMLRWCKLSCSENLYIYIMNKQRRQKMLPIQQIQAKLKQLKSSIRASEIKSLRSSCLYTETTPADAQKSQTHYRSPHNPNKSIDSQTLYMQPSYKKTKMKTTKSPLSMKQKTQITQSKTTSSPKKPLKDLIKNYIKSKFPKSKTASKSKSPKKIKKAVSPSQSRQTRTLSKKKPKLKTTVSPQSQKRKTKQKTQKTQATYYQPQLSKVSSVRLNTFSVSDDPHRILMNSIIEELQLMNENQMIELQQYLRHIKQEKKDEEQQTSLHEKINVIQQHQHMAQSEVLPMNVINDMCEQRQQGISLRVSTQLEAVNNLFQQEKISPRSFNKNAQLLQYWSQKQADKLNKLKKKLEGAQQATNALQKRIKSDFDVVEEVKQNELVVIQQLQQLSFEDSSLDQSEVFTLEPKIIDFRRKDIVINQEDYEEFAKKEHQYLEIQTNVGTINVFIEQLCNYLLETNLNAFLKIMNYPYGLQPFNKLREIHGHDLLNDEMQEFPIQTFILSELQQNSHQIETIHNRAVFDAFNEILNKFRPFYYSHGQPYPWEYGRHLTVILYDENNICQLLEKAKDKILEYASTLCGLLNDDDDGVKSPDNYEQLLQSWVEQDYLSQLRNERLQLSIINEINETDYEWNYTDQTPILVELTDCIFEKLVDELTLELQQL